MAVKHIIQKQVIELEMPQSLDRIAIQNRVSRIYREEIVPLLDKLLSDKGALSTLVIDRLEINIGRIPAGRLEEVLAAKIGVALQESLAKIKTPPAPKTSQIMQPATARQESHSDAELVVYFLQTGVFPWWAQETTYALLEKAFRSVIHQNSSSFKSILITLLKDEAAVKRLVYTFSDDLLAQITEQLINGHLAAVWPLREQLFNVFRSQLNAQQLREYWWLSVYQTISETSIRSDKDLFEIAGSLFVRLAAQKSNRTDLLQYLKNDQTTSSILEKIASFISRSLTNEPQAQWQKNEEEKTPGSTANAIAQYEDVGGEPSQQTQHVEDTTAFGAADKTDKKANEQFAEEIDPHHPSALDAENKKSEPLEANHDNPIQSKDVKIEPSSGAFIKMDKPAQDSFSEDAALPHQAFNSESKKPDDVKSNKGTSFINTPESFLKPFIDIDKIYILNAGLVLLWPFLHRFFQNMGLTDDKTFTAENGAERACLLLQYLATGSTEDIFEAQLPLNKMMCGIPLLQPVNREWTISDEEKELAEYFLLAIIQNGGTGWKNLTITGLQQAYLNREGIISGRDGNWLLQVKHETYDILVDRLPWTVQVVKLPWMERLVFVEW